jgi:cytochrome c553
MITSSLRRFLPFLFLLGLAVSGAPRAFAWDDRPADLYVMCQSCHGHNGEGNQPVGAPAINGLPEWYIVAQLEKFANGARGGHPKDINGMRMRPVGRMLTAENRVAMAKYVSALKRPSLPETVKGNPIKGETKFQVCVACHGKEAEGNQQLQAPPLVGMSDWYLVTQLHNFKNHIRGADAALDPMGASMAGMAATLDDEGVKDVVSYINALKPQ